MSKYTSIGVKKSTKGVLDEVKKTGQSYDGVIQELVKVYKVTILNTV